MRIKFEDFKRLADVDANIDIQKIVKYTSDSKRLEVIMNGAIYNRSSDKRYVLDNVEGRASHIDLKENEEYIKIRFPELPTYIQEVNIDIPAGEFYLMQDIYQLPDSGNWKTQQIVPIENAKDIITSEHILVHPHEGTLIDNRMINSLRRRTSYIIKDNAFVRSRDNNFKVRKRPYEILLVIDNKTSKEAIKFLIKTTPQYRVSFFIIKEAGVNMQKLDKGEIEHIGLIRHLIEQNFHPDIILFEPKRKAQLQLTETTIMQHKSKINVKYNFKGIKCGELSIGTNSEELNNELLSFCQEEVKEIKGGDTTHHHLKNESPLNFDIKFVSKCYCNLCKHLGINDEKIKTKINTYVLKASQLVMKLVEQKLINSVNSTKKISNMTKEEKNIAINKYINNYPKKISLVRASILYEVMLTDTIIIFENFLKKTLKNNELEFLEESKLTAEKYSLDTIKQIYFNDHNDDLTNEEYISLYQRDYNKLIKTKLLEIYAKKLGKYYSSPN